MTSLEKYVDMDAARRRGVTSEVNLNVIAGDGMFQTGGELHYIECGLSAVDLIRSALHYAGRKTTDVSSVLDFACGYGRVLRWLQATFPAANLTAVDTDAKAVAAVSENFKVDARVIDRQWSDLPSTSFDLVWVGSLFTHLSEEDSLTLFGLLRKLLNKNGILAATMHGRLVVERLRTKERDYGLSPEGLKKLLTEYDRSGYGFSGYPNTLKYGISANNLAALERLTEKAGLYISTFVERGWVKHQDFFGCSASQERTMGDMSRISSGDVLAR